MGCHDKIHMSNFSTFLQTLWNYCSILWDDGRSCGVAEVERRLSVVEELESVVEADPLLNTIPSVQKRVASGGCYFHACKDTPDVRAVLLH